MKNLDSRVFFSFKVLLVTMLFLVPVGLSLALDENTGSIGNDTSLPYAKPTITLGFEPIEIISMRTAISKTYDNGDGSYKAVIFLKPVHIQDANGNWLEKDQARPTTGSRSRAVENFPAIADSTICGSASTGNPPHEN